MLGNVEKELAIEKFPIVSAALVDYGEEELGSLKPHLSIIQICEMITEVSFNRLW